MKRLLCLAAAAFACLAAPSYAIPLGWSFNVNNTDGTINGSFIYDADTDLYSNINIVVTPTGGSGIAVNNFYSAINPSEPVIWSTPAPSVGGVYVNLYTFLPNLWTNAGGSVAGYASAWTCDTLGTNNLGCDGALAITGGNTTFTSFTPSAAVPLPASAFLLIGGIAGFGLMRRKQPQQA